MYSIMFINTLKNVSKDSFFASDVRSRDSRFKKILDDHKMLVILSVVERTFGINTALSCTIL